MLGEAAMISFLVAPHIRGARKGVRIQVVLAGAGVFQRYSFASVCARIPGFTCSRPR